MCDCLCAFVYSLYDDKDNNVFKVFKVYMLFLLSVRLLSECGCTHPSFLKMCV